MKTYNADFFIKKFEKIPSSKWGVNFYKKGSVCCALGHCGYREDRQSYEIPSKEGLALIEIFRLWGFTSHIPSINDGIGEFLFWGENPKERILYALENIRQAGG